MANINWIGGVITIPNEDDDDPWVGGMIRQVYDSTAVTAAALGGGVPIDLIIGGFI